MDTDTTFLRRVDKGEHWVWTGTKIPSGAGQFSYSSEDGARVRTPAAKHSWLRSGGRDLYPGEMIRPTCDEISCVRA